MPADYHDFDGGAALALLQALPYPLIVTDNALRVQFVNARAGELCPGLNGTHEGPPVMLDALQNRYGLDLEPLNCPVPEWQLYRCALREAANRPALADAPGDAHGAPILDLVERAPLPAIVLDEALQIAQINAAAARIVGGGRDSWAGASILELFPAINLQALKQHQAGQDAVGALPLQYNGHAWHGILLHLPEAAAGRQVLLLVDVTEYRQQANYHAQLLRLTIHDLVNLLNIPLNYAELADEAMLSPEELTSTYKITLQYLRRMKKLLSDLRMMAQVSEDASITYQAIKLPDLVAGIFDDLRLRAEQKAVQLHLTPPPASLKPVFGSRVLLQQAVYNLVENAIKYSSDGGWVRVTCRQQPGHIELLVTDSGIGIPQDKQAGIFQPFYRVRSSHGERVAGTGLGLSLVRMIAERHDGEVWFTSRDGQGSTFALRLPVR